MPTFANGQISGKSAVNTYGGPYTRAPATPSRVGDLASTMMAGPEPDMRAETSLPAAALGGEVVRGGGRRTHALRPERQRVADLRGSDGRLAGRVRPRPAVPAGPAGVGTSMTGPTGVERPTDRRRRRAHGEREAARERQSHVRHELRAPLAVMYPALSCFLTAAPASSRPSSASTSRSSSVTSCVWSVCSPASPRAAGWTVPPARCRPAEVAARPTCVEGGPRRAAARRPAGAAHRGRARAGARAARVGRPRRRAPDRHRPAPQRGPDVHADDGRVTVRVAAG